MTKIKKLVYLLQLEEYQTDRYFSWLKKHSLEKLEEKKGSLQKTPRAVLTLALSFPLWPLSGAERAVGFANQLIKPLFRALEEFIVLLAKLKITFHPSLAVIVVTGSYGKTTFKEMLASALKTSYSVLKTPQNINTRLGIAKMIIKDLKKTHQIMIVEAGAYQKGEIKKICQLVRPSFGVITIIGFMHLERFKTLANIRQAKMEIIPFIKDKKKLFIPAADHQFINFEKTIIAIGQQLKVPATKIKKQLNAFSPPEHRLKVKILGKNLLVLDDTYNANPLGFKKALEALKRYHNRQKIVITPGMIELGKKQFSLNKKAAEEAAKVSDILIIVGETNKRAFQAGVRATKKTNLKTIYLQKNENWEKKLTPFLKLPAVILLENELPDHYF